MDRVLQIKLISKTFWNSLFCCQCFMQWPHPVTHPAEYLEWSKQSDTKHTLTSLCWKCAGSHMYVHENTLRTHTNTEKNLSHDTKARPEVHPRPTSTLLPFSHFLLFLGGGHPGVTCLFLKPSKHWGESPLTPLKTAGIPVSRRPTSLCPTQVSVIKNRELRWGVLSKTPSWKHFWVPFVERLPTCWFLPHVPFSSHSFFFSITFFLTLITPTRLFSFFSSLAPPDLPFMPNLHALIPLI